MYQGLTLVLDRHSHKVSAATVAEDFKGRMLFGLSFEEVLQAKAGKWSKAYIMLYIICIQIRKGKWKDVGSTFQGIKMVVSAPQEFPLTRENVILIRQLFTLLTF